ncbi:MAG: cell division protein ZapA [Deltaproteobacteria bacterium]|nr:cell division protein ZapA [Deltaproteobacteria bacterium]MBW2661586.1 cell division protein ZapA [Deltaproteobacteria bacterium]
MEQLVVTIELFGQPYTFKAESEVAKAKDVADSLVKEVEKVERQQTGQSASLSNLTILIIAALNIANENFELKKNYSDFSGEIFRRSVSLVHRLDDNKRMLVR